MYALDGRDGLLGLFEEVPSASRNKYAFASEEGESYSFDTLPGLY